MDERDAIIEEVAVVEATAKTLCRLDGRDPESAIRIGAGDSYPLWHQYRDRAETVIAAIVEAERRRVTREIEALDAVMSMAPPDCTDACLDGDCDCPGVLWDAVRRDKVLAVVSRGVPEQEERDVSYLPMDCPKCGRHRLEAETIRDGDRTFVRRVQCEKCRAHWPDEHPPLVEPWDDVPEQEASVAAKLGYTEDEWIAGVDVPTVHRARDGER